MSGGGTIERGRMGEPDDCHGELFILSLASKLRK